MNKILSALILAAASTAAFAANPSCATLMNNNAITGTGTVTVTVTVTGSPKKQKSIAITHAAFKNQCKTLTLTSTKGTITLTLPTGIAILPFTAENTKNTILTGNFKSKNTIVMSGNEQNKHSNSFESRTITITLNY